MSRRLWLGVAAAVLAAIATALALADLHVGPSRTRVVLALDRSASIDPSMLAVEASWLHAAAGHCVEPCRVVAFAAGAQTLPPDDAALAPLTPARETDLARGVAAAVSAAPSGGRVVVVSDGLETAGDAAQAVAAARARDVTVDAVPLTDATLRDAAVVRLEAPQTVHRGDTVSLLVSVRSATISPATLFVTRDGGRPTTQVVQLRKGDNPFTLSYTATGSGWHSFRVAVRLLHDRRPQNDARTVSVEVGPALRVVVASTSPHPAISGILAGRGARVAVVDPAALPSSPAGYASVDAVVLDDVPARTLSRAQVAALTAAVRDFGEGLVVLGGRHAYSLGGYARSPLNALLPVASLLPGDLQRRNLAIELVLDRSGSMADRSGGVRKITMAQSAARQVAAFIAKHQDELGIVDFDIVPHVLVTMRRVLPGASAKRVLHRIDRLKADGGTDIYLGLKDGLPQLLASKASRRHVILMTDGISQPHNYGQLLDELAKHHIAVATVALGAGADVALLRSISAATGGNAYAITNGRDLPRIFVKETRLSAKPVQIAGRQQVVPGGSSPIVRSLAGRTLPALAGNVVTRLRPSAQADLLARSASATADPALAQWGYGTGRVVSWTPGLGAPWASAWSRKPALWNDAVRWAARGAAGLPATVTVTEGASTRIELDLAGRGPTLVTSVAAVLRTPHGPRRLLLRETAPSIYTASLEPLPVGSYGLTLALPSGLGGPRRLLVDVPYPAEYVPAPLGRPTLAQLAVSTGGELLAPGDPASIRSGPRSLLVPLVALAIALFLASVALRMLTRRPRPATDGPQATSPPRLRERARRLTPR